MITMAEIARLTGVSQPTVSRVLSGNTAVNAEVRERVLACAQAHNYQPNALAKSLHGRQTHLLGVLLTDIANGFFAELAKELERCAKRAGYSIILLNSGRDETQERECFDVVRRYRVDGVVAVPVRADSALWTQDARRFDVPVVAVTLRVPGLDSIYVDHTAAGCSVAHHLLERGYNDFIFAGSAGDDKGEGFFRELAAHGVDARHMTQLRPDSPNLREVLDVRCAPDTICRTGIFASNDLDALMLLNLLRSLNIPCPARAGVIGFDDIPVSRYLNPTLSSTAQPLAEMAGRAVRRLVERIEQPAAVDGILDAALCAFVVPRESTGAMLQPVKPGENRPYHMKTANNGKDAATMKDIITIGEILIDLTQTGTNEHGVPVLAANPGGAPANVAVAAARLGADTAFIGKAGADGFGAYLRRVLRENNVDDTNLLTSEAPTTMAIVSVDETGERDFRFVRGADAQLRADELDAAVLADTKFVHFGSVSLTAEPARSATLAAARAARKAGVLVSYDPNYRAALWPDKETAVREMRGGIQYADLVKISDEEVPLLTGVDDPEEGCRILEAQGVRMTLVTMGGDGALCRWQGETIRVPGVATKVADTNGAGDTFFGAVLCRLAHRPGAPLEGLGTGELREIVSFANRAASMTCSRSGAIPAMPTLDELNAQ